MGTAARSGSIPWSLPPPGTALLPWPWLLPWEAERCSAVVLSLLLQLPGGDGLIPARVLVPCSAPCAVQRTQQRLGREQLPATPGEPKPQAAAKTSSAPRFCQRRLLFVASSVSPAASHYAFRMEGPCISLINKVRKTGPLRKS